MYLFLSPDDSKNLYPDNSPADFIVELPRTICGNSISLQHVYYKVKEASTRQLHYILCDLVEASIVGGQEKRALGSFFQSGSVESAQELPLSSKTFRRIRIKVINSKFEDDQTLSAIYLTVKIQ